MPEIPPHTPDISEATDADIAEIVAKNEAGIADLLAAYDIVEQHYFAAAAVTTSYTMIETTTTAAA